MMLSAVRHLVVHRRVSIQKRFGIRVWPSMVGMDGLYQLRCSVGTQQPGFSMLEDGHLLNGRFFIGVSIESLDVSMFELTLG